MSLDFSIFVEEFESNLDGVSEIVEISHDVSSPKIREGLSYASTLLLSAIFEMFILDMAREYAKNVIKSTTDISNIPPKFGRAALEEIFFNIKKNKPDLNEYNSAKEAVSKAKEEIKTLYKFMHGDLSQSISYDFIKNEHNMRLSQINKLFQISGLRDVCNKACKFNECDKYFGEQGSDKTHGLLDSKFNDFFNHRNNIAHSLKNANSLGPNDIDLYLKLFKAFSKDLCSTLEKAIRLRAKRQGKAL